MRSIKNRAAPKIGTTAKKNICKISLTPKGSSCQGLATEDDISWLLW